MNRIQKWGLLSIAVLMMASIIVFPLNAIGAGCDCSDTADPPFLAAGSNPNLLLLIDNSASMYDMAYQKSGSVCFDDTYNNATVYAGYFETNSWYSYSTGTNRFEVSDNSLYVSAAGTTAYSNAGIVSVLVGAGSINGFKARGNFLNWATASRFDIEKQILTGGKYAAGELESEGRGCSGNRFLKQITVTSGGSNYKLLLGVRTDDNDTDNIDTTLIDIFPVTTTGFDPSKCQQAIDLMTGDPSGFGQVKQAIYDCFAYNIAPGSHDKQALIESLHDCWYLNKQGDWPPGGAQGFKFDNWCAQKYATVDPRAITRDDPAYVCFGDSTTSELEGFVGECWIPSGSCHDTLCAERALGFHERCNAATGKIEYCTDWNSGKNQCKKDTAWQVVVACTGGPAVARWMTDAEVVALGHGWNTLDDCITAARERFCGYITVAEVVDPSDLQMSTGETWNIPAMLKDTGAISQVGVPLATLKGKIVKAVSPTGLLDLYSTGINIGAMAFNKDGSKSECSQPEPYVTYDCDAGDNRDGTFLLAPIGTGAAHNDLLRNNINLTKANTWTPLAEAMFNAIGYYTQRADLRLNSNDFNFDTLPIGAFCEKNNVLMITDGASTADLNPTVVNFARGTGKDQDVDPAGDCGDLHGSTYLDDLTYYANKGDIFSGSPYPNVLGEKYQNISTFLVVPGTPRDVGAGECSPKTLLENAAANGGTTAPYIASDPSTLKDQIEKVLREVMKRASAGSAASVIAATRSGEGAVYQAIFWPAMDDPAGKPEVSWIGEVHALLVDEYGLLYEDTNDDNILNTVADQRVVFYFDETNNTTMACEGTVAGGICTGTKKSLHEVKYLWSAAEWLSGISDADIVSNRSPYISSQKKRYIFTWDDLNNNGAVDIGTGLDNKEVLSFVSGKDWAGLSVVPAGGSPARATVPNDFGVATNAQIDSLVDWLRGKDDLNNAALRKRQVPKPANFNIAGSPNNVTWRLGDIIHSTPTAVGRPAESYHFLYSDGSYAAFMNKYQYRRQVIYFGGNDGMLHAVNGGFFNEVTHQFCLGLENDGSCSAAGVDAPALGAELWAYVPYNLLPHLHCLKEPDYLHKYFIDLKPRIFDVRIFVPDVDHPNGWGTVLVAGMGFGGKKGQYAGDGRYFVSSFAVLDITNPEKPPTLLGELTFNSGTSVDVAYTISMPAVVPMKEGDTMKWYLVIGSGPTDLTGVSNQDAKISVFPLDTLIAGSKVFRIPSAPPAGASEAGSYSLASSPHGMVSDIISVDFDLEQNYRADALYFGTIEGNWGNWSGRLYRWVTNADAQIQTPQSWFPPSVMFNPGRPITAAPAIGYDGDDYWVYFGTGRFLHKDDKTDPSSNALETYYGLKEPLDCDGKFTWAPIENVDALASPALPTDLPGKRSLLRADQILVHQATAPELALLSCSDGSNCLPPDVKNFSNLVDFVVGTACKDNKFSGTDGWYLRFPADRERNLGQATLLGGLLTYTTYQPFTDVCKVEGEAYLYGVYYQTGTAWYRPVFGTTVGLAGDNVVTRLDIGRGLATTPNLHVGKEEGAKAFVQTSTGAIVEIDQPILPIKNSKSGRKTWRSE